MLVVNFSSTQENKNQSKQHPQASSRNAFFCLLFIYMCECMYICVCVYTHVYIYTYKHIHAHSWTHIIHVISYSQLFILLILTFTIEHPSKKGTELWGEKRDVKEQRFLSCPVIHLGCQQALQLRKTELRISPWTQVEHTPGQNSPQADRRQVIKCNYFIFKKILEIPEEEWVKEKKNRKAEKK